MPAERPTISMLDKEISRLERKKDYIRILWNSIVALTAIAAVTVLIFTLCLSINTVDGLSMAPLLDDGQIVVALKSNKNIKQNDVVALYHNNKILIKRVIAVGNQTVDIGGNGVVYVDGKPLAEPYVPELSVGDCDIGLPFQTPDETFFVMGDNRPVSKDSRTNQIGVIGRDRIIGRVLFRVRPFSFIK